LDAPWRWNVTPYFLRDLTIVIPFSFCKGCGALGLCLPFLLLGSPLSVLRSQSNPAIQLFLAKHFPARTYSDVFKKKAASWVALQRRNTTRWKKLSSPTFHACDRRYASTI
jgi:hypothetical protein